MSKNKSIALTLICLILGIILSWQYKSVYINSKTAFLDGKTISELREVVLDEKKKNEDLTKRYNEIEKENTEYRNSNNNIDVTVKNLNDEIKRLEIMAGVATVKGKGLIITLDNDGPSRIKESYILDVINELRASDSQAVSVNDERITAMSEIREAGRYVMVNGKQLLAPFVIKSICNSDKVKYSLTMLGGVVDHLENDEFIKVDIKSDDGIVIPKVNDDGSIIKYDLLTAVEN